MNSYLRTVQFHPDTGAVALLIEQRLGEHVLSSFFVVTTEEALHALAPTGTPAGYWSNEEALAEGQRGLDERFPGEGLVLEFLPAPVVDEAAA